MLRFCKNMTVVMLIVIIVLVAIFPSKISFGAEQTNEQRIAGNTIAKFAENFYQNYKDKVKYCGGYDGCSRCFENRKEMYDGKTLDDGFYYSDCAGWINFAIHQSLKIDTGGDSGKSNCFVTPSGGGQTGFVNEQFKIIKGNNGGSALNNNDIISEAAPGDILIKCGPHVLLYVGNGQVIDCGAGEHEAGALKKQNINDLGYGICAIVRITEETAKNINFNNCTEIFNSVTGVADDYGLYYGTTSGSYAGSYTFGQWLFDKFAGFFDYLAGILTYVFKAQFLGWGNIIEELVNLAINKASGMETITVEENKTNSEQNGNGEITSTPGTGNLYTPSATNTMWSTNRINIEDIIYNRVPLLDVNFLDVKLDRYKKIEEAKKAQASSGDKIQVISEDSIVYALRSNIAKWYIVIRQICIIVLLLLLIYLGIRLAISTVAPDKAKYKGMLVAWLSCFIVVFCIHYYMMIVIEINEVLVDIFAEVSQNAIKNSDNGTGSQSIYDTMRTRAYSLKLSEGFPATIFYMVLIYFLIRFLFIYIKRYFTIMILAVMGPIMSLKNCFDKISTGKSKSMSKWMYNFALNVFLQTIHAIIYCMFMVMAFDLATDSVAGFIMSLIVLNFIFKAEKIFMNIFNFEGRASSLRDVNENKNYFAEAYKVGLGITMFGGTALKFGYGAVAGSGRFLREKVLSGAQIGTSAFNRLRWRMQNIDARINGEDSIEYTPINLREKFDSYRENKKNNRADKLNRVIEGITGKRNLRLDLHNIKKQDPLLYEKTKEALKLKRQLKWNMLKRTVGDSTKSIRYMAELMMGVPMLVIDTQSGISALADATSGLKGMGTKKKEYGYRRNINGKKGNLVKTALNAATFGGVNATENSIDKFKDEHKKIVKNSKLIGDLDKANILESKIQKEIDKMIQDGKKDKVEKIMDDALEEVMSARKIKEAVSRYMAMKGVKNVTEAELCQIVEEINSELYRRNVDKSIAEFLDNGSKGKLSSKDIDKILGIIDEKVEIGLLAVINDKAKKEPKHTKVKNNVKKSMKKEQEIDIDKVKELLKSEDAESSFGIEITKEVKDSIARNFDGKKSKALDKKQAVSAIEDAILAGSKEQETDLGRMMRELKTLREKTKNTQGKTVVNLNEFTKGLKEKLK
ncbi:MAG: hypothetical protein J6D03_08915 [Clostridia bacterium]|nr:hypothetical protein [Clostridia bacterium]